MKVIEKSIDLGGRKLTLKTGGFAEQATSAVMITYGETVVLATVVSAPLKQNLDYFPLTVDYQERLYAGGRIKGSRWVKREGRPTDEEILTSRLIDRSIRPLFPKTYKKEVQVMLMVLSVDLENSPDVISGIAASAALAASSIPWSGPVGVIKVGVKEGQFFTNPVDSEMPYSDMELVVASTKDAIVMIEAGSKEVTEEIMLKGIEYAQVENAKLIAFIEDFAQAVGAKKEKYEEVKAPDALVKHVKKLAEPKMEALVKSMLATEGGRSPDYAEFLAAVSDSVEAEEKGYIPGIVDDLTKKYIRDLVLKGKRVDGRKTDEIRPLSAMVSLLPRTHGSAIFQRGQTQVMSVATLGTPSMEQLIETAEGEETKRYIHHYSMPPYSTGETGRVGSPSRREIGHGALAERALLPVIPAEKDFPYTVRIVSEVLSSNGSTSMASACGSTLSLMDAGVPIKAPVSGIAMGLVIEDEKKYAVLTDIMGLEDFNGDMDFKIAGTDTGITALQLDVKTLKLTLPILTQAVAQAKTARAKILKAMLEAISEPRSTVSTYAPKIKRVLIPVDKIGELIGPGGRNIKKIIADTGAQVDVEDDGTVSISGMTDEAAKAALERVEALTKEVQPGEIYEGTVKRVQPFGAFVEVLPGKEGLVHVSDMSTSFVNDPAELVAVGDKVSVRVKEIDNMGRINLSMILDPSEERPSTPRNDRFQRSQGGSRRPMRNDRRGDRDNRGDRGRGRSSGPHFPTSRFLQSDDKKYKR